VASWSDGRTEFRRGIRELMEGALGRPERPSMRPAIRLDETVHGELRTLSRSELERLSKGRA